MASNPTSEIEIQRSCLSKRSNFRTEGFGRRTTTPPTSSRQSGGVIIEYDLIGMDMRLQCKTGVWFPILGIPPSLRGGRLGQNPHADGTDIPGIEPINA